MKYLSTTNLKSTSTATVTASSQSDRRCLKSMTGDSQRSIKSKKMSENWRKYKLRQNHKNTGEMRKTKYKGNIFTAGDINNIYI